MLLRQFHLCNNQLAHIKENTDFLQQKPWSLPSAKANFEGCTQMFGPLFDIFTGAMFTFSSVKFLDICKPRTGWHISIGILWKWASKPTKLAGDGECRLIRFHLIRNFLQMTFIIFQGCPIKQAVFLTGQPTPYDQLVTQPFLLVLECYFA